MSWIGLPLLPPPKQCPLLWFPTSQFRIVTDWAFVGMKWNRGSENISRSQTTSLSSCRPFFRSGMTSNNLMESIKTKQNLPIMTKKTSNPKQWSNHHKTLKINTCNTKKNLKNSISFFPTHSEKNHVNKFASIWLNLLTFRLKFIFKLYIQLKIKLNQEVNKEICFHFDLQ